MLFSQTTLPNIFGFIRLNVNIKITMFSSDFNQLLKNSLIEKLSHSILIMGENIKHFHPILHPKELHISLHPYILYNTMGILNSVIAISSKPVYLFFPMPLSYWSYAFATAIYLINHMPTPTLQLSSPYVKLFRSSPIYSKLHVFGC